MDDLRRGFKTEAEEISLEIRDELGLSAVDRLDCLRLAEHLEIPVGELSDLNKFGASSGYITQLLAAAAGFSALTVCDGSKRLIICNPRQPPGRRANSLAHELSHIILEHPAERAIGDGGCRRWNGVVEAEADWLAATLLVPRQGALQYLLRAGIDADGSQHFGVSSKLFQWRANVTGVKSQIAAASARRGGLGRHSRAPGHVR